MACPSLPKLLVAAWFASVAAFLGALVTAIFTLARQPVLTVALLGGTTGLMAAVSLTYLAAVTCTRSLRTPMAEEGTSLYDPPDCVDPYSAP